MLENQIKTRPFCGSNKLKLVKKNINYKGKKSLCRFYSL